MEHISKNDSSILLKIDIFDILNILEKNKRIEKDNYASSYCDLCQKTHQRQWFISMRANFSFYVCIAAGKIMCKYRNGRWKQMKAIELIEKIV